MDYEPGLGVTTMRARLRLGLGAAILWVAGCSAKGDYTYMDDDLPSGQCDTDGDTEGCAGTSDEGSTTSTEQGGPGSPCDGTGECNDGLACSAPFAQGERGTFACVDACIETMDELRWCADADACCDPEAVCTMRGYCVGPDGDATTGGDATTTDDDDSGGNDSTTGGNDSTTGGDSTDGSSGGDDR
jgi:hypothetical protein